MNKQNTERFKQWELFITSKDPKVLNPLIAEDILFSSPFYWKPQPGAEYARILLNNICQVFEEFTYHRLWMDEDNWALEFHANALGMELKGIDLMRWNSDNQLIDFEVMVRPMNALSALGEEIKSRITAQLNTRPTDRDP
jgi:hypothetical protein